MKNILVAVSIAGMSLTTFGAPLLMKSESSYVKVDKKKKKAKKKRKHGKCEAYNG